MLYKVNDKAKKFRKKGFPHYAATLRILRDTTATGSNAYALPNPLQEQIVLTLNTSGKRRKMLRVWNRRKVDLLKAKHKARASSVSVSSEDHGDSLALFQECTMATLNAMEDLDGPSYVKALKLLKDDPSWRHKNEDMVVEAEGPDIGRGNSTHNSQQIDTRSGQLGLASNV
ncbi:hypothetical protein Acr_18g0008610 [Actinidia rufa]|uniref:Uncharacterized protein n=1 Tax=Actinidia rufa TaxID=165716 RepID=A0A7J0G7D5_9ERIC|nr:hypothetical protein Acr_18g0008610 [Actinidia rufa]